MVECPVCKNDVKRGEGWIVSSGSPAGNFLGLDKGEEVRVHNDCMDKISSEIE
jgi:hypothetical protein